MYIFFLGCATVVLETVLALQSYAVSRNFTRKSSWKSDGFSDDNLGPNSNKITASTNSMCGAVAKLTQWADRVIMDGCVDPTEDYVNQIGKYICQMRPKNMGLVHSAGSENLKKARPKKNREINFTEKFF